MSKQGYCIAVKLITNGGEPRQVYNVHKIISENDGKIEYVDPFPVNLDSGTETELREKLRDFREYIDSVLFELNSYDNQKGASQMTEIVAKSMIERINVKLSDKTIQVEGTGIELTENGDLIIWNGDFVSFVFAREQWFMACFADLDYA